jgi:glycolate oxidase FAD binding subunit
MTALTNNIGAQLESLLGASVDFPESANRQPYAIDGVVPSVVARPASTEQAAEIVRFAAREKLAVIPVGARTKLLVGAPPTHYDIALDMSAINQIAHYDPADLTVGVDAGMPVAKFNAALLRHKQFIPLLVPYYSQSTVGGTIACGLDSPLRNAYGTARDFLLGAEFIDGTGALVKSGGRVVKNVSGYDLHKLLIGSLGTLAVITRLNFRTFPMPLAPRGFLASFASHEAALHARQEITESPLTPLTLDVFNPAVAKIFANRTPSAPESAIFAGESNTTAAVALPLPGQWFRPTEWQLCAGFAGTTEVLDRYTRDLTRVAEQSGVVSISTLDDATRPSIWGRLREALPLFREASPSATILKLDTLPTHHAQAITILESVANAAGLPVALIARASGTLYVSLLPDLDAATNASAKSLALLAREVIALARNLDGRASLLFAPPTIKLQFAASLSSHVDSDQTLMRRLKSAFDPQNIFAPGRLLAPESPIQPDVPGNQ